MKFTITAVAAALLVPAVSAIDQYCPHAVVRLDCSTSAVWTDFKTYVSQQLEAKYNARYGNPGNDLPKYYLNNTVWQSPIGNAEEPGMLGAKKKGGSCVFVIVVYCLFYLFPHFRSTNIFHVVVVDFLLHPSQGLQWRRRLPLVRTAVLYARGRRYAWRQLGSLGGRYAERVGQWSEQRSFC